MATFVAGAFFFVGIPLIIPNVLMSTYDFTDTGTKMLWSSAAMLFALFFCIGLITSAMKKGQSSATPTGFALLFLVAYLSLTLAAIYTQQVDATAPSR